MKIAYRRTYDFVCGIGHYCVTANYLKRHYLRIASGPFDWHAQGQDALLANVRLIENDFAGFLRREALTPIPDTPDAVNTTDKDFYKDEGNDISLFHDFPRGVPLNESYPIVRAKYDRRIARFYKLARSGATLLVYHTRTDHVTDDVLKEAVARLRAKLSPEVDLLVVEWDKTAHDLSFTEVVPGAYRASGPLCSEDVRDLLGNRKLCDCIYGAIRFRGKFKQRLRKILAKISFKRSRARKQQNFKK